MTDIWTDVELVEIETRVKDLLGVEIKEINAILDKIKRDRPPCRPNRLGRTIKTGPMSGRELALALSRILQLVAIRKSEKTGKEK